GGTLGPAAFALGAPVATAARDEPPAAALGLPDADDAPAAVGGGAVDDVPDAAPVDGALGAGGAEAAVDPLEPDPPHAARTATVRAVESRSIEERVKRSRTRPIQPVRAIHM